VSSDGGAVWIQIDSLWYNDGGCVIGHPDSANVVISGGQTPAGNAGVSVSRNAGATWTRTSLSSGSADFCYALALAPAQSRTVYAGGLAGGTGAVYRSTDLGATWARTTGSPPDTVFGLAVHPADAGLVLAATHDGLFRTTNAGANWTQVCARTGFRSVRFLPGSGELAAAGGDSGAVRSTDAGVTWADISAGLEDVRVTCLEFAQRDGDALIAGTRGASCWLWDVSTGVKDAPRVVRASTRAPTIVRNTLFLPASNVPRGVSGALLDIGGRRVLDLHSGLNDVSGLAPGVYFIGGPASGNRGRGEVRKVVIQH
jgi:photosystem II stability/assembly factor-like uncharacterized protein